MKHNGYVAGAVFSRDETRILTCSDDGTARLWDVDADLDLPSNLFKLQPRAITGFKLNIKTSEYRLFQQKNGMN